MNELAQLRARLLALERKLRALEERVMELERPHMIRHIHAPLTAGRALHAAGYCWEEPWHHTPSMVARLQWPSAFLWGVRRGPVDWYRSLYLHHLHTSTRHRMVLAQYGETWAECLHTWTTMGERLPGWDHLWLGERVVPKGGLYTQVMAHWYSQVDGLVDIDELDVPWSQRDHSGLPMDEAAVVALDGQALADVPRLSWREVRARYDAGKELVTL